MKKLKRIISAIVLTSITITLFQTNSIYADSMNGTPDGQADVDQNYKNPTGESGWNSLWQGYRFYIVDRNFNLVSSILDVTTEDPMLQMSGNEQYMYDSIAWEKNSVGVHERKIYKWTEVQNMVTSMPNSPNAPLFDSNNDNKYDAQGDNLRAWIEKGIGGLDIDKQILELKKMTSNTRKSTITIGSLLPKTGGKSGQTTNSKSAKYSSQTTVDGIIQSAGGVNSFFSDVYAQEAARQLVKDTGVRDGQI